MLLVRAIAAINQKGGVGKTTTTANLGVAIAARGRDICLVDLDPQSHLTLHFNIEPDEDQISTYDVLTAQTPLASAAAKVGDHLWVAPAVIDLAAVEIELATTPGREQLLRRQLAADLPFEFVMIDCPPSLGLLTLNALAAVDDVFIPLQPHFLALQGLGRLLETISLVQHRINPELRVGGVILCMYEQTTRLAGEVVADLEAFFDAARKTDSPWASARIFESVIRRNIKLAECPSYGQTIFEYAPSSNGAKDYGALADEFILWADGLAPAHAPKAAAPTEPAGPPAVSEPVAPEQHAGPGEGDQPAPSAEPDEAAEQPEAAVSAGPTEQTKEAVLPGPPEPAGPTTPRPTAPLGPASATSHEAPLEPDPIQAVHDEAVEELLEETCEYHPTSQTPLIEDDAGTYLPGDPTTPSHSEPGDPDSKPRGQEQ